MPKEVPGLKKPQSTSKMLPTMTYREEEKQRYCLFTTNPQAVCYSEKMNSWEGTRQQRRIGSTDAAVKAVERGMEVEAWSQAVHLQKHLSQEQSEEQELCIVWKNKTG